MTLTRGRGRRRAEDGGVCVDAASGGSVLAAGQLAQVERREADEHQPRGFVARQAAIVEVGVAGFDVLPAEPGDEREEQEQDAEQVDVRARIRPVEGANRQKQRHDREQHPAHLGTSDAEKPSSAPGRCQSAAGTPWRRQIGCSPLICGIM